MGFKRVNQSLHFVQKRVSILFFVKCFLTAKLRIIFIFQDQNVVVLNYGLGLYFKEKLMDEIKMPPYFTIFDKSLKKKKE